MRIWIRVTWKAVEAAVAALKDRAVSNHDRARKTWSSKKAAELRAEADQTDAYAEEFRESLHGDEEK